MLAAILASGMSFSASASVKITFTSDYLDKVDIYVGANTSSKAAIEIPAGETTFSYTSELARPYVYVYPKEGYALTKATKSPMLQVTPPM